MMMTVMTVMTVTTVRTTGYRRRKEEGSTDSSAGRGKKASWCEYDAASSAPKPTVPAATSQLALLLLLLPLPLLETLAASSNHSTSGRGELAVCVPPLTARVGEARG